MSRPCSAPFALVLACQATADAGMLDDALEVKSEVPTTTTTTAETAAPEPPRDDVDTPDVGAPGDPCDSVDLLFVVDNSQSMADEQAHLVAGFPGFIEGIGSILGEDTDYHVGVVTTDDNRFNGIGCRKLGALVTRTGGESSSDAACGPYAEGFGYMTPRDPLDASFGCAAKVGVEGDGFERPMEAIGRTLGPSTGNLALCNEGFLRDGALLVLTIITDEDDAGDSPGDPAVWHDAVVEAKGGDPGRVVVLSLVGHPAPNDCIDGQWNGHDGAEIAERIIEFTGMFEHGHIGDVCSDDYGAFFTASVAGVADACHVVVGVN
jgi:hypothetical protein